jgi:hydrogenase maturation protease
MKNVLILGVGNILLTDEGVGVRVIEELDRNYVIPSSVELYDGGTGGLSLLPIVSKADYLIIVDSVLVDEEPGTIVRFNIEDIPHTLKRKLSSHEVDILDVISIAEAFDKRPPAVVIGVQPQDISSFGTDMLIGNCIPDIIKVIQKELQSLGIRIQEKKNKHKVV